MAHIVFLCVAVSSLACASPGRETADTLKSAIGRSAAPDTGLPLPASGRPLGLSAKSYLGELRSPIETLVESPREFLNLVGGHVWKGTEARRLCKKCLGGLRRTRVRVGAIEDAHTVNYHELPSNGVIIGRLENRDKHVESKYGMPGKTVWYILWGGDHAAETHMRFVQLNVSANHDSTIALVPTWLSSVGDCGRSHLNPSRTQPDADFATCAQKQPVNGVQPTAVAHPSSGVWMSCSQGCCTADGTPLDPNSIRKD